GVGGGGRVARAFLRSRGIRRQGPSRTTRGDVAVDNGKISSYSLPMGRRKKGSLLAIEVDILDAGLALRGAADEFHGFELAKQIAGGSSARRLTSHGTLYKALGRLEDRGLLASRWEDAARAADAGRPRRRLYHVTGEGERVLAGWRRTQRGSTGTLRPGVQGQP
ncbi:PadR family transcriptional regulator, partial [Salsipaludibacter albus]|uniref:PadR family transcriptional regulator n=1 Tax=Salsipaludibacter albus TaxID=2849650 RepID=UPI001EE4441B